MMDKSEALAFLEAEAKKRGKTLKEFMEYELRIILEKAWEIQRRTGKSVPFTVLHAELKTAYPELFYDG